MCLNIYANIDNDNIFKKNDFINTLHFNQLDINIKNCNINCWIYILEYCIDEQITGRWQRIIPSKTVKIWSQISNQILEKTNKEFKMVVSQNESADYNDVKKMTLYLDICNKFNTNLEFI
jgi:RecJ-like exonuclease